MNLLQDLEQMNSYTVDTNDKEFMKDLYKLFGKEEGSEITYSMLIYLCVKNKVSCVYHNVERTITFDDKNLTEFRCNHVKHKIDSIVKDENDICLYNLTFSYNYDIIMNIECDWPVYIRCSNSMPDNYSIIRMNGLSFAKFLCPQIEFFVTCKRESTVTIKYKICMFSRDEYIKRINGPVELYPFLYKDGGVRIIV
jgi:hypothetical protein